VNGGYGTVTGQFDDGLLRLSFWNAAQQDLCAAVFSLRPALKRWKN
jgi:hypothetical protein